MTKNPYAPEFKDLPEVLPIFPLDGALLLPFGYLPLNIFETHYLAMVEAAMANSRMIGMIQTRKGEGEKLYRIGCAGKITDFKETDDGRYEIVLQGISRFEIDEELPQVDGYRRVRADWSLYRNDLQDQRCLNLDRPKLKELLAAYFEREGMACDFKQFDNVPDGKLITCLSMVCPFNVQEKQALLQAECCTTRASVFMTMLEMALMETGDCKTREH